MSVVLERPYLDTITATGFKPGAVSKRLADTMEYHYTGFTSNSLMIPALRFASCWTDPV